MIEVLNLNPFNSYDIVITRSFDENKSSYEYMRSYIAKTEIVTENEFYVLFSGGVLCKKGRSGVKTSEYLSGKKLQTINQYYGN